ncbi:hypothetical protein JCM16106_09690 [Hydrogenophilus islandicus]
MALRLLSRREATRAELMAALVRRGFAPEEVARVVARAESLGFISDARAATTHARRLAERQGNHAIVHRLAARGVGDEAITEALRAAEEELGDEASRAALVWQKKFSAPPTTPKEWQRQARFLAARGFSWETIRRLLDDPPCSSAPPQVE